MENIKRGRIICATGGGKTWIEYTTIYDGFFSRGNTLQILVAPTISLLKQHHETFENYGMFHRERVVVMHFRTGEDARRDDYIDYEQTTNEEKFLEALAKYEGRKIIVFVTYASEKKMFDIMRKNSVVADCVVFDEFHHCVKQTEEQREHLLTLPVRSALFFSASEKRGRVVSSLDTELFGEKLVDISYARLRQQGILVPKVLIKTIRLRQGCKKLKAIAKDLVITAEREGLNIKDATMEAAAIIVAREDLIENYERCNLVTFSKAVADCKVITKDSGVQKYLGGSCDINTVHAGTPGTERLEIFEKIKKSHNSVLCQHSIVKEGIDVTSFNALVFSRKMEVIGTQQALGRIVRADPRDTENLKAGKISIDDPTGWKKYYAVVYVVVTDDDMEDFTKFVKEFYVKLRDAGLTTDDFQFIDLADERNSVDIDEDGWIEPIRRDVRIDEPTLNDHVKNLAIEVEDEEKYDEDLEKSRELSMNELVDAF